MLRKLSRSRAAELELDVYSLPEELSAIPSQLLQSNVKVPRSLKKGKMVTVVLGNGAVEPRLVDNKHLRHSDNLTQLPFPDRSPSQSAPVAESPQQSEVHSASNSTDSMVDIQPQNQSPDYLIDMSQSTDIDARSKVRTISLGIDRKINQRNQQ